MSNYLVNIRIGLYHFTITNEWKFGVSRNEAHLGYPNGRFQVYQFFS